MDRNLPQTGQPFHSDVLDPAEVARGIHNHASEMIRAQREKGVALAQTIHGIRTVKVGDKFVWQWQGFDTVASYFAAPLESGGLDLGWRMAERYYVTYRDFGVVLHLPPALYSGIDFDKMEMARHLLVTDGKKIADDDMVTEVLTQAKCLSRSDFRSWVREQKGLPEPEVVAATPDYQGAPLPIHDEEMVRAGGELWVALHEHPKCCLRPWQDGERCHIPVSKGAGGKDWQHCVLPVNHSDHMDQHSEGMSTWLAKKENHQGLFRYLYHCIFVLLAEREERDD